MTLYYLLLFTTSIVIILYLTLIDKRSFIFKIIGFVILNDCQSDNDDYKYTRLNFYFRTNLH